MSVTTYHNPRRTKSRAALAVLREQGVEPDVIEHVLECLSLEPREILRTGEEPYQRLHLDNPEMSRKALITAMVHNPILIERPIVVADRRGRWDGRGDGHRRPS